MKQIRYSFIPQLMAAVFLILVTGCGKDNKGATPTEPVVTAPTAITDIATVAQAPDRKALNGRAVTFSRVTVQGVVGNFIFWGGPTGEELPIVRGDRLKGEKIEHVRPGEQVDIVGTVRTFESVGPTDPYAAMWDSTISNDERTKIEQANVFIAADKVTVLH